MPYLPILDTIVVLGGPRRPILDTLPVLGGPRRPILDTLVVLGGPGGQNGDFAREGAPKVAGRHGSSDRRTGQSRRCPGHRDGMPAPPIPYLVQS